MMRCIDNKGSATYLIVLLVMVILTVTIGFNWLVREYIKTAQAFTTKVEAMLKARSAFDTVIFLMLNGRFTAKEILIPKFEGITEIKAIPLNGKEIKLTDDVSISVQASNGLISLTTLNTIVLGRLLRYYGLNQENINIAIDSLLDWIDQDDLKRLNGAERQYYSSLGLNYSPRNYPIQYKEELALIRGFGDDIYKKIEPYITILPSSGFNPNIAPDPVLVSYLDLTQETLNYLKEYISTETIDSDSKMFYLTGKKITEDEGLFFFPTRYLEVKILSGMPKPYYKLSTGINLMETIYFPYSVIYWKED